MYEDNFNILNLINFVISSKFLIFSIQITIIMRDQLYDNADSFAMSFDEEWKKINCEDLKLKIDKVFEILSDHPFLISNPENARKLVEFRIFSLKKLR